MTDQTREAILVESQQEEFARHQQAIEDLTRQHKMRLEEEQVRHADRMVAIARIYKGERIPGVCVECGMDLRHFHQWEDYEKCPRCRTRLED